MRDITFSAFAKMNLERNISKHGYNHPLENWSPSDWLVAALGELGEAANNVKKMNRIRDGLQNKESYEELLAMLKDEVGDVVTYMDLFCQRMGFTMASATLDKFDLVSQRIGYSRGKRRFTVYLAGPFFNPEQKAVMKQAKDSLASFIHVIDPQELSPVIVELPEEERSERLFEEIYRRNVEGVAAARLLVANVDTKDTGTTFEMGYAAALGIPILTFAASPVKLNVMLQQATLGHCELEKLPKAVREVWLNGRYEGEAAQVNE